MSIGAGLSTVSELVKQSSLHNVQQYSAAQEGLNFAQTALKTSKLTYTSQEMKLNQSREQGLLTDEEYQKQLQELRRQSEVDCAPWQIYVTKLSNLIEKYSSTSSSSSRNSKRHLEPSLPIPKPPESMNKRTRITFPSSSSSSSSSEDEAEATPSVVTAVTTTNSNLDKQDRSTSTDPWEFSLRTSFPPAPSIISFTAQTNRRIRRIPFQQINELAAQQMILLHDEGQLVRWNEVIWRLFTHYQVEDLGHLGLTRADQIPCIEHLVRLQTKIDTYLDAYAYYHNLGTLSELEMDLARLFHKNSYDELFLGPIEKQPKVEQLFHLRSNVPSHSIRKDLKSSDVLKYLDQYMTKEHAWISEKDIQIVEFLKYIADQLQVKHLYQLGIRMKSVYLSRTCIKAMQANQRKTMEIARNQLNDMLAELAENEVKKIRQTIEEDRESYATMDPLDVLNDLTEICRNICHDYASFRKFSHALELISKDSMLRNLFQIALCRGRSSHSPPTTKPTVPLAKKTYFSSSDEEGEEEMTTVKKTKTLPNEQEILRTVKEQLGSIQTLNFTHLVRIEERLCEKYQLKSFEDLEQGSLIKYLEQHDQSLFSNDMSFDLISSKSEEKRSTTLIKFVSREDLEEFLLQGKEKVCHLSDLEERTNYHFQVQSFDQLGYGTFSSFLRSIEHKRSSISSNVHYECFVTKSSFPSSSNVVDPDRQALNALEQCPFLSNIALDLQWNLLYRSKLGSLKTFLHRHRIPTLQLDHQTFLKISSNSSIDDFRRCLENKDPIGSAGHLVSILVHSAPFALLTSTMENFFAHQLFNEEFYRYLYRIFHRIPSFILLDVLQRLFIDPLMKFEGSQRLIREKFAKIIAKEDLDVIRRFEHLGEHLGVTEWFNISSRSVDRSVIVPSTPILTLPPPPVFTSILPSIKTELSNSQCPFDVIERIRREKFGIGLDLSAENQRFTDQLKSLLGRSLERLSKDLYNNDMHFVLELIQNADDNRYDQTPALLFLIDEDQIEIFNNEIGFEEENIQALCDIGKSTKGKHQQGYIGQKGIGFKSVFTVTDRPEIYSNGYRISFDATNGPIGYILPNWIDEDRRDENYAHWTTRIALPLKSASEREKHRSRSFIETFHDIQSSLLLFLHRLRSITIENRLTSNKQIYQREDLSGTHLVKIHGGEFEERWFVLKRSIQSTEIAFAFPLHEFSADGRAMLTKKDLFAYLPLRTFGFTFIIQADFEVPSSRQDILSDSFWNETILEEIPSFFLQTLDVFHREAQFLPIDPLSFFLEFLPHPSTIFGSAHFISISRQIFQLLRKEKFLPVIDRSELYRADQCVLLPSDHPFRSFLTDERLEKYLNLHFLPDRLQRYASLLHELGVRRLTHDDLIELLKEMFKDENDPLTVPLLGQWFFCFSRSITDLSLVDEEKVLHHLRTLNIIPLRHRSQWISLHSLDGQSIFFPSKKCSLPKFLEEDLMIVDEELWTQFDLDSLTRLQVQQCLERLGIQRFSTRTLLEHHLYPLLENKARCQEKPVQTRNALILYLFDLWSKDKSSIDFQRLKTSIEFSTNEFFRSANEFPIYFPLSYGNRYDLKDDFPSYRWIFLSDVYLNEISPTDSTRRKLLHQFFRQFGVHDFLLPIHRWTIEQFDTLIQSQSTSINQKLFLRIELYFRRLNDEDQREFLQSPFFSHLKQSKWIPTVQPFGAFDYAQRVFLRTRSIEELLGHHVPYLDLDSSEHLHRSFVQHLGLLDHITLPDLIARLIEWSQSSFSTSLVHMNNVYRYLAQMMNVDELRTLFDAYPLIFIPKEFKEKSTIVEGRFLPRSRLCWHDASNLFNKYPLGEHFPSTLEAFYPDDQSLFANIFAIRLYPTIEEYLTLLVHIASLKTTDETIDDARRIFHQIGKCARENPYWINDEDLRRTHLLGKAIFPTRDHRWISSAMKPMYIDDDHLGEIFASIFPLRLLARPSMPGISIFYDLCGIPSLSSTISIEHRLDNATDNETIRNLLSPLIPFLQLFMQSRPELRSSYQWTRSISMVNLLEKIRFQSGEHLKVMYRYRYDSSISITEEEKCSYDEPSLTLYMEQSWLDEKRFYRELFSSFAKVFLPPTERHLLPLISNFLSLLHNEDLTDLQSFAKYHEFDLHFKDPKEIPWRLPTALVRSTPLVPDESKVQTLLAHVAEKRELHQLFQQRRRQMAENAATTTSMELVEEHRKQFTLEDLTHQVLDRRDCGIGADAEALEKIGRWGEEWVHQYLQAKYHEQIQSNQMKLFWLNERLEQGKPYDFILEDFIVKRTIYIEVKSTISASRHLVPITFNELQYCCTLSDKNSEYVIYRVYNTGKLDRVQLKIVNNLEEKLRKHALELFLLI